MTISRTRPGLLALALAAVFAADAGLAPGPATAQAPPEPAPTVSAAIASPEIARRTRALIAQEYPPLLRDAGVGGEVVIRFLIAADGGTGSLRAMRADHEYFRTAAMRVVDRLRFPPAAEAGRAVPQPVEATIVFLPDGGYRSTFIPIGS